MRKLSIAKKGLKNIVSKKPLCVSFEVTYRCNARCKHCHLGGPVEEDLAPPERFAELCRELDPVAAQISGGEPLLRKDILQIIEAIVSSRGAEMGVITTNGWLLRRKKYESLRAAGVDEFSLSLDYPDKRHDDFRAIPGLFDRIVELLNGLRDIEDKGITLACVVQSQNFRDLIKMAEFAREHRVNISFSTYTWLRTEDKSWMIPPEDMGEFREVVDRLLAFKREYNTVFTSEYVFKRMLRFFETGRISNCRAGEKFLVVNPDGTLSPCGLLLGTYKDQRDVVERFLKCNTCEACNTSIRANTEKPLNVMLKEALRSS
jgi:MoaA/NifB/PqqE/SkfB family radical SAM enzyme